ncbi:MAG: hypothetical protein A2020_04885 [Lentisphaerae bacterium GWF2_45_14]|nr:MAG: hypothetical protein A2020_04885 [Lentisphaerae bacterium GWF2_45_14]
MKEKQLRSILKAISWRLIGTLDTIILSWIISGKISIAVSIGVFELFTKMFLYYLHERGWNRIKFGKSMEEISPVNTKTQPSFASE